MYATTDKGSIHTLLVQNPRRRRKSEVSVVFRQTFIVTK